MKILSQFETLRNFNIIMCEFESEKNALKNKNLTIICLMTPQLLC